MRKQKLQHKIQFPLIVKYQLHVLVITNILRLEVKKKNQKFGIMMITNYLKQFNQIMILAPSSLVICFISIFKETYKSAIHSQPILNIYCITNTIILTSSIDKTIIKTDIIKKQQLFLIKAHNNRIDGLDYNQKLDVIASSSDDKYIKLWNANTSQLVLQKQNANNNDCNCILQVLFIIDSNQLISLDDVKNIFIWNINYNTKQLQQYYIIKEHSFINNISLVLAQYITLICDEYIKIYTIKGDFVKQFNHDIKQLSICNIVQPKSMKASLIQGINVLQICKFDFD
ncbi:hypothetical protein pb186bvf_015280 [Paramecium bursaria]